MENNRIGIIGGSGLYELDSLTDVREEVVSTPFGEPSDKLTIARLGEREVVFIPRHGRGHRISPSEVNYRANICALKMLGARWVLAISAVGSMKEELRPRDVVFPDQFIDRTRHRQDSFFTDGIVAHVSLADPFCEPLRRVMLEQAKKLNLRAHDSGTYLCMEGPQFSTRAESELYRSWGVSIIGMTNLTEARLAREAELGYATAAFVTDYDCWHESEDVSVEMVMANFAANVESARKLIETVVPEIPLDLDAPCFHALRGAIVTDPARISAETRQRLKSIAGKYL
jgi:5'-methylthioadenosine phosphorylase